MRRVGLLALATAAVWLVAALPAGLWLGGPPAEVTLAAAAVCFVPAALTLALLDLLRKRSPEEKVVAALVATFLRMGLSLGGGAALYYSVPVLHEHGFPFVSWVIVFYLVTLAVETGLLYTDTTGPATGPADQ
jgi:hypothetical protein